MDAIERNRPYVGVVIGDPSGIGPEVTAKAWVSGLLHECCRPVLIGSAAAMEQAARLAGKPPRVRVVSSPEEVSDNAAVLDVIDSGALDPKDIVIGKDNLECGRATGLWFEEADRLAREGKIAAMVLAPVSSVAMKMAGVQEHIKIEPPATTLVLLSGPLRVAHATDHIPLREACATITADVVFLTLKQVAKAMVDWGIGNPKIVVAGLNAHAMGTEEADHIAPGVAKAKSEGIDVIGPVSPDAVFRQCIEGQYDMVLAMYHDQGHIAIKTWGFSGNSALILGLPYIFMSVGHGTAHEIAGRGVADHSMMLSAIRIAGHLAGGRGFPDEPQRPEVCH